MPAPLLQGRAFVAGDVTASGATAAHADAILRHVPTAAALRPDLVVRDGRPPASRVVNEWIAASGAEEHVVSIARSDPTRTAHVRHDHIEVAVDPSYAAAWARADRLAEHAIADALAGIDAVTEPAVARAFVSSLPPGTSAVVASSMPIRDVEWYAPRRNDIKICANRGANGIDGTIATAIGVALATGGPTAALMGDIAFLHDSTALVGLNTAWHRPDDRRDRQRRGWHLLVPPAGC